MLEQLNFLKIAILDSQIGAMTRSSKYVVKTVVRNFETRPLHRVVEYGPGDGVLTREILKRMPSEGELIVVETNPKFLKVLRKIKDIRLKVIDGTAQAFSRELSNTNQEMVDLVVSSIPFSIIGTKDRENIVRDAFTMLKDSGKFIIFHQYSPLMLGLLHKYFAEKNVRTQFELRNILPCFIMSAEKHSYKI